MSTEKKTKNQSESASTTEATNSPSDKSDQSDVVITAQKSSNAWMWWLVGCCGCLVIITIIVVIVLVVMGYFTVSKISNEVKNFDTSGYDDSYYNYYPDDNTGYDYNSEDWNSMFDDWSDSTSTNPNSLS